MSLKDVAVGLNKPLKMLLPLYLSLSLNLERILEYSRNLETGHISCGGLNMEKRSVEPLEMLLWLSRTGICC